MQLATQTWAEVGALVAEDCRPVCWTEILTRFALFS